jgi:hypothetical protein
MPSVHEGTNTIPRSPSKSSTSQVQRVLANIESHLNEEPSLPTASKRASRSWHDETYPKPYNIVFRIPVYKGSARINQSAMRLSTLLLLAAASAGAQEATEPAVDASSSPQVSSERLDRCATLGFDADALDCRLCDELSTFLTAKSRSTKSATSVDSVTGECQDCCSDFSKVLEAEGRRYPIAVLAVSRRRLKRYPKVANFVEHQAEHIKGLDVEESNPRLPMLQFFDANGDKMEEIRCVEGRNTRCVGGKTDALVVGFG